MSQYINTLLAIAQDELPSLDYDITNASTLYTLQACMRRMHTIVSYVVHELIFDAQARGEVQLRAPAPTPVAQAPAQAPSFPSPTRFIPPFFGPQDVNQGAGVGGMQTEVFITPQGTKVVPPGGQPAVMVPPGQAVDAASLMPRVLPVGIPMAPPGPISEVVLPQGGGMTPEVAAALGRRPQPATVDPTGGARNITHDPQTSP